MKILDFARQELAHAKHALQKNKTLTHLGLVGATGASILADGHAGLPDYMFLLLALIVELDGGEPPMAMA